MNEVKFHKLNLPEYKFKIKETGRSLAIYDEFRNKYVSLTPEEWVRQNFIQFLVSELGFPKSRIALEMALSKGNSSRRCDAVVFGSQLEPIVIIECKKPEVNISQKVFNQIGNYNISLKVNYLIVTNGLKHYCCKIGFENNEFTFLKEIPDYRSLLLL